MLTVTRPRPRRRDRSLASLPPIRSLQSADAPEDGVEETPSKLASLEPMPIDRRKLSFDLDPRFGILTDVDPRPFAERAS